MKVMLLAAGLGTRLRPLTDELPKALVWLGDRPLIDGIIARLAPQGVDSFVVNTHHLAERFDGAWVGAQPGSITLVHEPHILGTGGGVANAAVAIGPGDVLVWNADIAAGVDVAAVLDAHERGAGVATLLTGPRIAAGSGTLGLDARGAVARMRDLVRGVEVESADYAGIAMLSAALRAKLPAEGCLVGDALMPALERGERVQTSPLASGFSDLGTPKIYLEANLAWLDQRGAAPFVHAEASIASGVRLVRSVVAKGARVEGHGELAEVVVWPGATAIAPLRRAIVTRARVVSIA